MDWKPSFNSLLKLFVGLVCIYALVELAAKFISALPQQFLLRPIATVTAVAKGQVNWKGESTAAQ